MSYHLSKGREGERGRDKCQAAKQARIPTPFSRSATWQPAWHWNSEGEWCHFCTAPQIHFTPFSIVRQQIGEKIHNFGLEQRLGIKLFCLAFAPIPMGPGCALYTHRVVEPCLGLLLRFRARKYRLAYFAFSFQIANLIMHSVRWDSRKWT